MLYSIGERRPDVAPDAYVAPSADVIGSVRLAEGASVWFHVVLRGDNDWIDIGPGSNIQDGSVIHTDEGVPTRLGARVTVGHMAFLHCCTVGDVPPDKEIPDGSVVMGSPGKIVREVSERDLALIRGAAASYARRAQQYRESLKAYP
jgi:carbonic anhydrase/acetyltransferase-like protein (isoleucine patch superfamily)